VSPAYTLVVVAYHRPDHLRRLLDGVAQGPAAPRGIVVVNVEGDAEVERVATAAGATTVVVPNRGYAAAVNRGVQAVSTGITVFSGDDLQVSAAALARLAEALAAGVADVAVPQLLDTEGHAEASARPLPTPGRILLEWALTGDRPHTGRRFVQKWRRPERTERVEAFDAALVAVRTDVLRAVPLPEAYFLYWEELDWSFRLRAAGRRAVLVPDATVRHEGGRADVRPDKQRLLARNAVRCVARTQGRSAAARVWPAVVLWQLRLLVADGLRALLGREHRLDARWAGVHAAVGAWREIDTTPQERAA
jgi:GT2 family glycosyltransferase